MKIGGFQPVTLSDYPGHVAAIVFTQGCNFRCPFCHNASLLTAIPSSGALVAERDVFDALQARGGFLDAVVISGGEPTLQGDLAQFIDQIKQMGFGVKLDTNGSRPAVLRELVRNDLLDFIAMDVKAPWHTYAGLAGVETCPADLRESIAILSESNVPCEFRTTFVPSLLTAEDLEEIRSYLPRRARYTIQAFVPDNALDRSLRTMTVPAETAMSLHGLQNETNDLFSPY